MNPKIGIALPTLNAGARWSECLRAVAEQRIPLHRRLIIDSASTDSTVDQAVAAGFEIIRIERREFNHGGTRQHVAEHFSDCDIVVFLTQDAILASPESVGALARCFDNPKVAVAYGRQLPHRGATSIEVHSRLFNYGPVTQVKDAAAICNLGTKVFFCSNSYAGYNRSTLLALGGFRRDLILGEDMEFAARAVNAGYANVYCAEALVYHSHNYDIAQLLERYFDLGVFDHRNDWMRKQFGSQSGEGWRFMSSEIKYLASQAPSKIPRALCQTAAKLIGYRLGLLEQYLPIPIKRKLSMLPNYFRPHYGKN